MFEYKNVPVKWHRFIQYVFLPVTVLGQAWFLLCMIAELFQVGSLPKYLTPILTYTGNSVSDMGNMYWPTIFVVISLLVMMILSIYVFIGFLKWKERGRVLWLIYSIVFAVYHFILYLIYERAISSVDMSIYGAHFGPTLEEGIRNLGTLFALGRVFLIIGLILILITVIMNFSYYQRRRILFTDDSASPEASDSGEDYWKCEHCGTMNSTNFCIGCGSARPIVPASASAVNEESTPEEADSEQETEESTAENTIPEPVTEETAIPEPVKEETQEETVIPETITEDIAEETAAEEKTDEPAAAEPIAEEEKAETVTAEPETEDAVTEDKTAESEEAPAEDATKTEVRVCPKCGSEITDPTMKFCLTCGTKLED